MVSQAETFQRIDGSNSLLLGDERLSHEMERRLQTEDVVLGVMHGSYAVNEAFGESPLRAKKIGPVGQGTEMEQVIAWNSDKVSIAPVAFDPSKGIPQRNPNDPHAPYPVCLTPGRIDQIWMATPIKPANMARARAGGRVRAA